MFKRYIYCKVHPEAEIIDVLADGDIICKECALVLSQRNYGEEVLLNDKFEKIGFTNKQLFYYSEHIKEICERIHICESVINDAIHYLKISSNNKFLMSLPKMPIVVSTIYNSIKRNQVGITIEDLAYNSGIDKTQITQYSEIICDHLKINLEASLPESFIRKFRYWLDLSFDEEKLARHIATEADRKELVYVHRSEHVAAVCLLIASHLTYALSLIKPKIVKGKEIIKVIKTIKDIKEICSISNQTLYTIFNKLVKKENKLIPEIFDNFEINLI